MKISFLACGCSLALVAAPLAFSTPVEDVKTILQDFLNQPNYTWAADWSRAMPESADVSSTEEIAGQHETGGHTKMELVKFPFLPINSPPGKAWTGIVDREDFWSSRWVFETPGGWKKLASLPSPQAQPGGPKGRPGSVRIGGQMSLRTFGAWRPDQEVAIMFGAIEAVEINPDGSYALELSPEGAAKLACPPAPRGFPAFFSAEKTTGKVKLRALKGSLVRYELELEGTLVGPLGGGQTFSTRRVRNLKDLGTTVIEISEEAQALFGR